MVYQEAVDYILGIPKFTKKNTPAHTRQFLQELGNPEKALKVIHVAGTNGKGSVCAYLDAMLRAEGKSTGLFTSPHLVRLNERIVINGKQITDSEFLTLFEKVQRCVKKMEERGLPHPTFFEFLFGMAVTVFAQRGTEYAVLETGLGGRLDATNSVEHPLCTVITSIGLDHTEILGDTLEKIAAEKAGILKAQVPVYYAEGKKESNEVIEERAAELGIYCKKIGKNAFKNLRIEHKNIAFSCTNAYYGTTVWRLSNTGLYQAENAMLSMEVMRGLFGESGRPALWREALEHVVWEGRMEELLPGIYVDGAHNINAIERFVQSVLAQKGTLEGRDRKRRIGILFSAVRDKDYKEMIACLCRNLEADFYVVTQISDSRAEDTQKLAETFAVYTEKPIVRKDSFTEAWDYIRAHQKGRTIYCLGSLYLVGMLKAMIQEV